LAGIVLPGRRFAVTAVVGMISTIVLVFEVEGITVPPARADFIACVMAHPVGSRVIRPEQGSGGGRFGKMCSSSPLSLNKSRESGIEPRNCKKKWHL
jgi:hypothetical protein